MKDFIDQEKLKDLGLSFTGKEGDTLYFTSEDQTDKYQELLEYMTGQKVVLNQGIRQINLEGLVAESLEDQGDLAQVKERVQGPLVDLSNYILDEAMGMNASDIHIEPTDTCLRVRYRVDGKLKTAHEFPLGLHSKLVTRMKILGGLDISNQRLPQDGRFYHSFGKDSVDIRMATSPLRQGEKIVLRLLNKTDQLRTLEGLGLHEGQLEKMKTLLRQSNGLILFTGPTNSGKSTTIYAILEKLNREDLNIMTIEDPIEYQINGINQMQVNTKAKMDFSQGLRTMLRQDPDILMVGEIRNAETAKISIRAAITGHLLFSTIHTRDGISAIYRLEEMGVEPYFIADGILGVVAQRLLTCLCPHCKEKVLKEGPGFFSGKEVLYEARGCPHCRNGYLGRKGVFEIILFEPWLKTCINEGRSLAYIKKELDKRGFESLKDRIREELLLGNISLEEAYRCLNTI